MRAKREEREKGEEAKSTKKKSNTLMKKRPGVTSKVKPVGKDTTTVFDQLMNQKTRTVCPRTKFNLYRGLLARYMTWKRVTPEPLLALLLARINSGSCHCQDVLQPVFGIFNFGRTSEDDHGAVASHSKRFKVLHSAVVPVL